MDRTEEHVNLVVKNIEPFNAEPDIVELIRHPYTPLDLVYCRNHCAVPDINALQFKVKIDGEFLQESLHLTLDDLKVKFTAATVVAAMQCTGNRRRKLIEKKRKDVEGIKWDEGAIANIRWTGARMSDIITHAGLKDDIDAKYLHICFASSVVECEQDNWFGASIPLEKAIAEDGGVLLAYEMNGGPLPRSHGFPFRVVVPGYSGVRWVKWVDSITVSTQESPNFYQQRDYKVLPPQVDTHDKADLDEWWAKVPPLQENPLSSFVATIQPIRTNAEFASSFYIVKGYAISGPSCPIARVDVSSDGGCTWSPARITYQEGPWSWVLWEAEVSTLEYRDREGGVLEVLSRATDQAGRQQALENK